MIATTLSHEELAMTMMPLREFDLLVPTTSPAASGVPVVVNLENYRNVPALPSGFRDIDDVVAEWERDEGMAGLLADARRQFLTTVYPDYPITIRSLRLQKGWSQVHLATEMGTKQPYIARIERGTENLTMDTCRRLAEVFVVDLNTIELALRNQEVLYRKGAAKDGTAN
jgi:DNA-binding XRE family transcriptional regulator